MRKTFLYVLAALVCWLPWDAKASPIEVDALNTFEDWSVFKDEDACWIATTSEHAAQDNVKLDEQLMYVAFFYGSPRPRMSFVVPGCCDTPVIAATSEASLRLMWHEEGYFPMDNEVSFLRKLLKARELSLVSKNKKEPLLSFSLLGLQDAYNEVARVCKLHEFDDMDRSHKYKR